MNTFLLQGMPIVEATHTILCIFSDDMFLYTFQEGKGKQKTASTILYIWLGNFLQVTSVKMQIECGHMSGKDIYDMYIPSYQNQIHVWGSIAVKRFMCVVFHVLQQIVYSCCICNYHSMIVLLSGWFILPKYFCEVQYIFPLNSRSIRERKKKNFSLL